MILCAETLDPKGDAYEPREHAMRMDDGDQSS